MPKLVRNQAENPWGIAKMVLHRVFGEIAKARKYLTSPAWRMIACKVMCSLTLNI
ncbi:MAG: hypothetical protein V4772_16240 [Pseudomonadota bacterium]